MSQPNPRPIVLEVESTFEHLLQGPGNSFQIVQDLVLTLPAGQTANEQAFAQGQGGARVELTNLYVSGLSAGDLVQLQFLRQGSLAG